MLPSFTDLSYFVEVCSTNNISRAAERIGISQPSLSLAIKRLEQSLGTALVIRSKTGIRLTKAGKELSHNGQELLRQWQQLKADVSKKTQQPGGQYVIGCHPSVALYSLSRFIPDLLQRYPQLEITLRHGLSRKITEGVISCKIDFAIVVNPVYHLDLVIKELCTDTVSFWQANSLANSDTLICDPDLQQVQTMLSNLKKNHNLSFKRMLVSNNLEVITDLTVAGAGIGILPGRVANGKYGQQLKICDPQLPSYNDRICLVYRADQQQSKGSKIIATTIAKSWDGL